MRSGSKLWLAVAIGVGMVAAAGCAKEQRATGPAPAPEAAREEATIAADEAMVACAYDGMVMMQRGMGAHMDYQGKTLYFCSEDEQAKFEAAPEKYLREISLGGGMALSLHVLPVEEYAETMGRMGAMMKYEPESGASHHINVALFSAGEPVADAEVRITLTGPGGQSAEHEMAYAKGLKNYGADVSMPKSGDYEIGLEVTRGAETMRGALQYRL